MKIKEREFEVLVPMADGSGVAEKVKVMVPIRWDEEVQAWLMTPEAHEIIDNTKARLIGLLLPAQLKELRKRYDYSQREMGELFQVGEKSWTRWESGKHRPSRSINLLIRALYEGEVSINYLLRRAGKPEQEEDLKKGSWGFPLPDLGSSLLANVKRPIGFGPFVEKIVVVYTQDVPGQQDLLHKWVVALEHKPSVAGKFMYLADRQKSVGSIPRLDESRRKFEIPSEA